MSVEFEAALVLRHSIELVCEKTNRSGYRYHSSLISAALDVLTFNVNIYNPEPRLAVNSRVFVHGVLSEGTRGAVADLDVFPGSVTRRDVVGDVLIIDGMVHKLHHPSLGDCIIVRVPGVLDKWFIAVSIANYSLEVYQSIEIGEVIHVTGSFESLLHRTDDTGRLLLVYPRLISFPNRDGSPAALPLHYTPPNVPSEEASQVLQPTAVAPQHPTPAQTAAPQLSNSPLRVPTPAPTPPPTLTPPMNFDASSPTIVTRSSPSAQPREGQQLGESERSNLGPSDSSERRPQEPDASDDGHSTVEVDEQVALPGSRGDEDVFEEENPTPKPKPLFILDDEDWSDVSEDDTFHTAPEDVPAQRNPLKRDRDDGDGRKQTLKRAHHSF